MAHSLTPIRKRARRRAGCRGGVATLLGALLALASSEGRASDPDFGPNDIPTVFFVSKSDDLNRVDYGIRLDSRCAPLGDAPVFPYWREFENAPPVRTHALGWLEYLAYGISEQRVVRRTTKGGAHSIRLKAIARDVVIETEKGPDGRCRAVALSTISNIASAHLLNAHIKLRRALSVEYIDIRGRHPASGALLEERVTE